MAVNGTDMYAPSRQPFNVSYSGEGAAAELAIDAPLTLGDTVIIRHVIYVYNAFTCMNASAFGLRNVTVWAAAGMGVLTLGCTDVALLGLRIAKGPGRPMSISADGAHLQNTRGGAITVRGCTFEGQGDDGLNAPTMYETVTGVAADGLSFAVGQLGNPFLPGDTANFFNRSSLALLGSAVVVAVAANTTTVAPPGVPPGAQLVNNAAQYAGSLELTDNVFRNNRGHGAKLKSSNVLAARNLVEGTSMATAMTNTDGYYWLEGHAVRNWTFVNNTIHDCNFIRREAGDVVVDNFVQRPAAGGGSECVPAGEGDAPIQAGLTISGNEISSNSSAAAIAVFSADGVAIADNVVTYLDPARAPVVDLLGYGVTGAHLTNNRCGQHACSDTGFGA